MFQLNRNVIVGISFSVFVNNIFCLNLYVNRNVFREICLSDSPSYLRGKQYIAQWTFFALDDVYSLVRKRAIPRLGHAEEDRRSSISSHGVINAVVCILHLQVLSVLLCDVTALV